MPSRRSTDDDALRDPVMQRAIACRDELFGFLYGLTHDFDRAEDLLQETFVEVCRHWRDYDAARPFVPWAIGIAKHAYLESLRGRHRRLVLMESNLLEQAFCERQQEGGTQELLSLLRRCVHELSERQRRCFDMRYRLQVPHGDICRRLSLSSDAVYQLVARTRRALRACVAQRRSLAEGRA